MTALSNGNYVVRSPYWDNGAATDAGAVTWGNGTSGVTGVVSAANSLVGSTAGDRVGYDGVTALSQRQLRGEQPLLGQRRGGGCRGGHLGERDERASPAWSRPPTAWWAARPTIRSAMVRCDRAEPTATMW